MPRPTTGMPMVEKIISGRKKVYNGTGVKHLQPITSVVSILDAHFQLILAGGLLFGSPLLPGQLF
jgi:hypothetical protein